MRVWDMTLNEFQPKETNRLVTVGVSDRKGWEYFYYDITWELMTCSIVKCFNEWDENGSQRKYYTTKKSEGCPIRI